MMSYHVDKRMIEHTETETQADTGAGKISRSQIDYG